MMKVQFLGTRPGTRLAYLAQPGTGTGLLWLGGLRSDMTGSKAEALAGQAGTDGRPFLRFDYSGHGQSEGLFTDGTISAWLAECEAMFVSLTHGPVILCGSSMGGWLALLLYRRLAQTGAAARIKGLVLLAPATDMTEKLMWEKFSNAERETLMAKGDIAEASQYSPDPLIITRRLIEDGRQHRLLPGPIEVDCPVRILQGDADPDVPWSHGLATHQAIAAEDCRFILVKNGDHRLSRPMDLALLTQTTKALW